MGKPKLDICIVDDEIVVCKRLEQFLTKRKHRVETFVNSDEAVKRIAEKKFDIVVTDIRMESIDGLEVLRRVVEKGDDTKVIMITGYATIEIAREAQTKGAFDFISKPFKPQELEEVIDKAAKEISADEET